MPQEVDVILKLQNKTFLTSTHTEHIFKSTQSSDASSSSNPTSLSLTVPNSISALKTFSSESSELSQKFKDTFRHDTKWCKVISQGDDSFTVQDDLVQILLATFSSAMLSPDHNLPLPSNSMDHIEHCCKCRIDPCPLVLGIFTQNGQSSFNSNSFSTTITFFVPVKSRSVLHLRANSESSETSDILILYLFSFQLLSSYLLISFVLFCSPPLILSVQPFLIVRRLITM